jgi:hypothetical protein
VGCQRRLYESCGNHRCGGVVVGGVGPFSQYWHGNSHSVERNAPHCWVACCALHALGGASAADRGMVPQEALESENSESENSFVLICGTGRDSGPWWGCGAGMVAQPLLPCVAEGRGKPPIYSRYRICTHRCRAS